jgi:hypothetical protein
VPQRDIGQFLFNLPDRPLTREERVELIKRAIQDGDEVTQANLDQVMAKLLEELQSED